MFTAMNEDDAVSILTVEKEKKNAMIQNMYDETSTLTRWVLLVASLRRRYRTAFSVGR